MKTTPAISSNWISLFLESMATSNEHNVLHNEHIDLNPPPHVTLFQISIQDHFLPYAILDQDNKKTRNGNDQDHSI